MSASPAAKTVSSAARDAAPPGRADLAPRRLLAWADRHRKWILAAVVIVYLLGFNGQWRVEPDSALYLSIARNVARGDGYTYHGQINRLGYRGWPLLVAGTFKLFGADNLAPAHALMLLFALASLGLTYRLIRLHEGRAAAVVVVVMLAAAEKFFRYAIELRNDMPFLAGVLAVLAGYEAMFGARPALDPLSEPVQRRPWRWYDALLLVGGLALVIVMRPMMLGFVPLVVSAILLAMFRRGQRAAAGAVLLLAGGVLLLWRLNLDHAGAYESDMARRVLDQFPNTARTLLTRSIPTLFEAMLAEAAFGHEIGPGLNTVVALLILFFAFLLYRRRLLWVAWIAATLAMVLLADEQKERYLLAILPLLAYAWWHGSVWVQRRIPGRFGEIAFILLIVLWMGPNSVKTLALLIEQHRSPFLAHYRGGKFKIIKDDLVPDIQANTDASARILCPKRFDRILTYLCDRQVMEAEEWRITQIDSGHPTGDWYVLTMTSDAQEEKNDPLPQLLEELRQRSVHPGQELFIVKRAALPKSSAPGIKYALRPLVPIARPATQPAP